MKKLFVLCMCIPFIAGAQNAPVGAKKAIAAPQQKTANHTGDKPAVRKMAAPTLRESRTTGTPQTATGAASRGSNEGVAPGSRANAANEAKK